MLATRAPVQVLGLMTLAGMILGLMASILAWKRRRFAILLLLSLFELLAVGSLVGRTYIFANNYVPRLRLLGLISDGLREYHTEWKAFPPPPSDPQRGGEELLRFMQMRDQRGSFVRMLHFLPARNSESGAKKLSAPREIL